MSRPYEARDAARLQRAVHEYRDLTDKTRERYALSDAFDHQGFCIADYCDGFGPNPAARAAERSVKAWAQSFGMWVPGVTEHCNNLASYLDLEAEISASRRMNVPFIRL